MYLILLIPVGCSENGTTQSDGNINGHTSPSNSTKRFNQEFFEKRPFHNQQDFIDARRGLIAQDPNYRVQGRKGQILFDVKDFSFIDENGKNSPASVNPSLWRQAALNNIHGLFEVTAGIYQIRGTDLANMTIIEGDTGWIIIDPLTSVESARDAWALAQKFLPNKPIVAILFTHSHIDHFGGVDGILDQLSQDEVNQLRIIAPTGFVEEVTRENIIAGTAMGRRAGFMYGKRLAHDERGHIDTGLGKLTVMGSFTFEQPTEIVGEDNLTLMIDGLLFEFQMVSGTEAPSEFTFYLPEKKALCGAELVSRNLHNLYTLRGAQVRDAKLWYELIEEARLKFADAEVLFASHHWPIWGTTEINDFFIIQRDTYKFIHDQTVRWMNQGLSPKEIASQIQLPDSLNQSFYNQSYYGTLQHNAKAVYQFYLGWYTGNPAQLHPLPEAEVAQHYIQLMGGINRVLEQAQLQLKEAAEASAAEGVKTYRWLAELLNHAVYAEPKNTKAKLLLAAVYDQLGYQSESGPWRDVYLTGAYELRHGAPTTGISPASMKETLSATPVSLLLDSMSTRLNAEKAAGKSLDIIFKFTDIDEDYLISINNSVLHHKRIFMGSSQSDMDAQLSLTFSLFIDIVTGEASFKDILLGDQLGVEGSTLDLIRFISMIEQPAGNFNIVTP